jgi:superoxide reductase
MAEFKELFQTADWSKEKHVPVIDGPDSVKKGDVAKITITVGKAIAHPNTTEHHIRWITLFFLADGEKFPYQVARAEFDVHGESALGPNTSTIFANPEVTIAMKTEKSGTLMASSYCNIHGLWSGSKRLEAK